MTKYVLVERDVGLNRNHLQKVVVKLNPHEAVKIVSEVDAKSLILQSDGMIPWSGVHSKGRPLKTRPSQA